METIVIVPFRESFIKLHQIILDAPLRVLKGSYRVENEITTINQNPEERLHICLDINPDTVYELWGNQLSEADNIHGEIDDYFLCAFNLKEIWIDFFYSGGRTARTGKVILRTSNDDYWDNHR